MGNIIFQADGRQAINLFSFEPVLFVLAQRGKWDALILRTLTHPQEVFWVNQYGNTALHLACSKKPPLEAVVALLREFKQAAMMQTTTGMTPLHYACFCGASSQVIKLLIETCTKSVSIRDKYGRTPLHCACCGQNTSFQIFNQLLETNPSFCCSSDSSGRTPLSLILDDYADAIEEQFKSNKVSQEQLKQLDQLWQCVTLFLKTAHYGSVGNIPDEDKFLLIHTCVNVSSCPQRFFFLAVNLCPEQLIEIDPDGNLPLHVAASRPDFNSQSCCAVIEILLQKYPFAACVRSSNGSLPLQLAVKSCTNWLGDSFVKILEAHPEAIATLDIDFKYFPQILALAGSFCNLEVMFLILQSRPDLFVS